MDDDNNNQNDHPKEEQTNSGIRIIKEPQKISEGEFKKILEDHKKWLDSDGKEGVRAGLSLVHRPEKPFYGENLSHASFKRSNLEKAGFSGVNLQNTNFYRANLQEAQFFESNLNEADFEEANLKHARLHLLKLHKTNFTGADLSNASFIDSELSGTNLTRAKMQNTTLLNIKSFTDSDIQYANLEGATGLLGHEFAQADLTGTKLPQNIEEFKALETVKETSQNARKIFFAMLLGCVYSWLTIATTTDVRLLTNTASSPLPIIGTEIPIAWFYIAAPLVLICLYFYFHLYLDNLWRALASLPAIFPDGKRLDERAYPWLLNTLVRRHFKRLKRRPLIARMKEWITIFLSWFVVPFTMMAFWLRYIPRHHWFGTCFHIGLIVLSVAFAIIFYRLCALTLQRKEKTIFRLKNSWRDRRFYYWVSVILVGVLFSLLSYGAINGTRGLLLGMKFYVINPSGVVPWAFKKVGYDVFADFREKAVSEIPANYGAIAKKERLEFVKGANLKGRNLNYADMSEAFLVKADLRGALLTNTNLYKAKLQRINLEGANLQEAYLLGAQLQEAEIMRANLRKANLILANLQQAKLMRADLQQAFLSNTNIQRADLRQANLQKANFINADLTDAVFEKADLSGAKNLTIDQLCKVKTLYQTKLDPKLLEKVKERCPHLTDRFTSFSN